MMKQNNEELKIKLSKKLITHDGSFHADDIFAAATLSIYLEKKGEMFEIIRTRDEKIIKNATKDDSYVFDVGGIYDEKENRFDHHQVGGAGKRENGIEYASFGLVWKKFGIELCGSLASAEIIDRKLVAPIDAHDNGFDLVQNLYEITQYSVQNFFYSMRPTWREEDITNDEMFTECLEIAKRVLSREIIQAKDIVLAEEMVLLVYNKTSDKRILILDKNYPCEYTLNNFPEPLFIIYPRKTDNTWGAKAVPKLLKTFINRKNFPKPWAGLRGEDLQNVSGVADAVFCHRALYMAVAVSKEGAIKLAQIAVESK